jgi:pyruvate/2-oxoglutarate dehydrogenase complex dihydrolipoamide dehydrogenase (E3) component
MAQPRNGRYNVVVIGAGTAGLVTAVGTASLGGKVALIERDRMGGDCLNVGCVPSKALISSARLAQTMREAGRWGLEESAPRFSFEAVFARMRERRARIAPNDSRERMESLGIEVIQGDARFVSAHEVVVGEDRRLRAAHFVIATGSRPALPAIAGLDEVPYFTNETIFDDLKTRPESLLVLGGGPIACELGQAMQRLGVQVTLLQRNQRLLAKEDARAGDLVEQALARDGVLVRKGVSVKSAARAGQGVRLMLADGTVLEASALLIAAGRQPRIAGLGLEAAGVAATAHGIRVDDHLQTSQPHIYAAGDVAGPFAFTHFAEYQARVLVRNLVVPARWLRQKVDYRVMPWCTYTQPEVARVGLNEDQAKSRAIPYDLFSAGMETVDRAVVESEEAGFIQVLTARGSDRILGVTLVASHAGDLLQEFVLAMKYGIGLSKIGATIHPYPTFALIARQVAGQYDKQRLTPRLKRVFAWLYRRQLA